MIGADERRHDPYLYRGRSAPRGAPGHAGGPAGPAQRLAIVRGIVNGNTPAGFVLDTGGEATSLSRRVAGTLGMDPELRRVPAQVYGSSGWDRRAFLMPYVDIEFASGVGLQQRSVPVVNLDAPSALLGVNIGGIIGHELLSRYTLTIDLNRAEVGLEPIK